MVCVSSFQKNKDNVSMFLAGHFTFLAYRKLLKGKCWSSTTFREALVAVKGLSEKVPSVLVMPNVLSTCNVH